MKNEFQVNSIVIKCDNEKCNYTNENISVENLNKWINKPCPKCGEILLTQENYNNYKMLITLNSSINKLIKPKINDRKIEMLIEMKGTGKVDYKI